MIHIDMSMEDYRNGTLKDYISQSKLKSCGADDQVGFINSWVGSVVHRFLELGFSKESQIESEFCNAENEEQFKNQKYKADREMTAKYAAAKQMAESVMSDLPLVGILHNAHTSTKTLREASVTFEYDGLKMKCRPDMISPDMSIVVDWKTTSDITEFERSIWKYFYDVQAFFYCSAISDHSMSDTFPDFYFVVVDKNTYKTGVFRMTSDAMATGELRLKKLIRDYRIYLSGERRTFTENGVFDVNPPRWLSA